METPFELKKVLIISPHFPPSNLAAVHRSRLFALHLVDFGWEPIILTVDEKYYEEELDPNLMELVPDSLRIEKVKARKITRPRIVGDVGLRGFFQLYKRALNIIREEKIDFLLLPIPSFYMAVLGRMIHEKSGIPYGIDYIDPWVHSFAGSEKIFSRHWLSTRIAGILEPYAVKKASLITGVAAGYYLPVLDRNPHLKARVVADFMPYGGESSDHDKVNALALKPYLFDTKEGKFQLVYAGAMLPNAYEPLEKMFKAISGNLALFQQVEFHFIGTGKRANDHNSFNIKPIAEKYGLWHSVVFEYPKRIPYMDVLVHLDAADAIFILGSTEPHYTPSKVYQGVLSRKPIFAILHQESTAVHVLERSKAGLVLSFNGKEDTEKIRTQFIDKFLAFQQYAIQYSPEKVQMDEFDKFSARNVTKTLSDLLDRALKTV